jgi:hypothetical protein
MAEKASRFEEQEIKIRVLGLRGSDDAIFRADAHAVGGDAFRKNPAVTALENLETITGEKFEVRRVWVGIRESGKRRDFIASPRHRTFLRSASRLKIECESIEN